MQALARSSLTIQPARFAHIARALAVVCVSLVVTLAGVARAEGEGALSTSEVTREALGLRASEAISKEAIIRVYVSPAPGFGHQAATMTVMRRLRQIGFQGEFEVVYENSTAGKLATLVPGFDPKTTSWQTFEGQGMKLISLSEFEKLSQVSQTRLGITGAEDHRGFMTPEKLGVDSYLRLQPLEWGSSSLVTRNPSKEVVIPELNGLGYYADVIDSPEVIREELERMRSNPNLEEKSEGIRELFSRSDVTLGTIYGVGLIGNMSGRLKIWIDAVRSLQKSQPELFRNGVILPMLSGLNEMEVRTLKWELGLDDNGRERQSKRGQARLKFVDLRDASAAQEIRSIGRGEIALVQVGSVPQALYELLFSRSQLPLLLAGKNAMNLAQNLGKPYINTVGDYSFENLNKLSSASQKVLAQATQAFHYSLASTTHKRSLTRFILDSMTPSSEISKLFSTQAPRNRDKVAEAISFWNSATEKSANTHSNEQRSLRSVPQRSCQTVFGGR